MSQKTGKMLKRYALQEKKNLKDLKRWWAALPSNKRGKERAYIQIALQPK